MYKLYFWFAIIVPVLAFTEEEIECLKTATGMMDFNRTLLHFEDVASNLDDSNTTCSRDFARYVQGVIEQKNWANQMLDSMEKIPYGLLYGRTMFLGNFDECIHATEGNFTGKYCLVDIKNELPQCLTLSLGICMPSTCPATEIQSTIDAFGFQARNLTITVVEENCYTKDPVTLTSDEWIVIAFFVLVAAVAIASTAFDVLHQRDVIKSHRYELYSSFSLYKNSQQLVKIYDGPANIGCLHGIRSLTMCWVILCHEYVMGIFAPLMNAAVMEKDYIHNKYKIPIMNGFVSVDTFFLLSGLLVTLIFFRSVSKTGNYDVPVAMIHRFFRLTPALAAMMLIQSTLVSLMGKGPIWNKVMSSGVDACRESWWSGLLYIQNFVKPTSSCLGQSWYLSSDMQMFWLSPLLLYPLLLWRMKGLILMLFGLLAALTTNFVVSFIYELGPMLMASKSPRQFDTDYTQTHMRLTPYIVGMAAGYVICGIKANKIRINLNMKWKLYCAVTTCWLVTTALCLGSMYGVVYFFDNDYRDNYALSSSYLVFHRLGWSLGVSLIILACIAGYGGPVDYFLSWSGFQIIGKLSYCMFLVHFTLQMSRLGMMQTSFYAHDLYFVSNYLSAIVFSILFATPLYLFFEAPFSNLDRYFLRDLKIFPYPRKGKTESTTELKEESAAP